ncbi:hypothetical protein ZOSMA_1G00960, partial [Zostera marina]
MVDRTADVADNGPSADLVGGEDVARLVEETGRVVELARGLQDSMASLLSRTSIDDQDLRQRALALDSDLRKLQASIDSRSSTIDSKVTDKLNEDLYKARCLITDGDVGSLVPIKDDGGFLKAFLGPINVRANMKDVRLKVKEEYNSYRDRTAFLFLFFPVVLLLLRRWIWHGCFPTLAVQLYQAWLLFLYTSLALRENILRVNGSDIRT